MEISILAILAGVLISIVSVSALKENAEIICDGCGTVCGKVSVEWRDV